MEIALEGFKNSCDPVSYALILRDYIEEERLAQAANHVKNMLDKYQILFKKFENHYYYLKKYRHINHFILEDLKLKFGLCYDSDNITQLREFFEQIELDTKNNCAQYKFVNPNYAIKYAQSLLRSGEFEAAEQVLSFDEFTNQLGSFDVIRIDKDGNCFYRAVADQLRRNNIKNRQDLDYT